jgi:hypothetical protein
MIGEMDSSKHGTELPKDRHTTFLTQTRQQERTQLRSSALSN